jgi:MFS family permease
VARVRRYAFISLVDATGTGLFLAVSTLFFTRVAGLPAGLVGLGLSLAGGAAMLGAVPLGSLGDRLGHRRVWMALTVAEAVAYAAYPLVDSFAEFAMVVTAAALGEVGTAPIRRAYLSRLAGPDRRVHASACNQAVYNAGFAAGALGAAFALHAGTRSAYVLLVLANAVGPHRTALGLGVLRDTRFLVVSLLNGLLMTYGAVLTVALPLWIVERTAAPPWMVAALFLLNTLLATSLQVPASRGAETLAGATRAASQRVPGAYRTVSRRMTGRASTSGRSPWDRACTTQSGRLWSSAWSLAWAGRSGSCWECSRSASPWR